jgi:hypothetical protein
MHQEVRSHKENSLRIKLCHGTQKRRAYFTLVNGSPMREIIIQLRSFASSDVAGTVVKL